MKILISMKNIKTKILFLIVPFLILAISCSNNMEILLHEPAKSMVPTITLTDVSIESNNTDPTISVAGDTITLTFTADEPIDIPIVTIMGYSIMPLGGPDTFTATYVVQSGDPIGIVPFTISGITGLSGDIGADVSSTTDFSSVYNGPNPPAWELEVTTTAASQSMTVYLDAPVRIVIDWGDGNSELTTAASVSHTYAAIGVYTLKIRGHSSKIRFSGSQRLTRILSVVQGITGITSFSDTFFDCVNLAGSIPAGLFDNYPEVTSFHQTFFQCFNLTGPIPAGLFDNHTQVTTFAFTFMNCRRLTSIPAGLFDNNTLVTTFSGTFLNCYDITSIPPGLFDNNTQVTNFGSTFYACDGITSIPVGLFDNNTQVTNFGSTFYGCDGITSIPAGLFDNNTQVTNFHMTFYHCSGVIGNVPELWVNTAVKFPNLTNYSDCFLDVTGALNYASIPIAWK